MICSHNMQSSRAVKVLNTFSQLTLAIGITAGIFAWKGMKGKEVAIMFSFGLMRVIQPLFNYLESTAARSSKTA
jgi:hypothetical protein